ncbi:MAG: dehypoxanthine futalosine cyclase [Candidatus Lambdaproteobacteria bacterium RIFOXYD12_FULL_49_8]|uniref:Dehypoxanthine futalosine cyclase n=1 Tax=Candidatus Lambdaproteobacteria bacterium RIFOXYD2_FULL_50_16 TaxID=1817772 RepID=A0A1F6GFU2_9PROT|nr:MAG: dehypoxanthine futalosine cyclase [Candidatus Lambdaproteobacteria bacterium RIFOXYD12_FULL_49_8]OGG96972.1 MAG: dehypoxanthine futalosine cyclase [Candidatus Lambdaproteobacteria bacterium RIFOXYD2_FULL_50_16]
MSEFFKLYEQIRAGQRISSEEGLALLQRAPWTALGTLAQERRTALLGNESASYTLFRIINYTNVCTIDCNFCSFRQNAEHPRAYVMSTEEVLEKCAQAGTLGADQIFLQGGVHPDLPLDYYLELLRAIKSRFGFHIRGFSPVELREMSKSSDLKLSTLLSLLKEAGLDSVPGAGAEILAERVRKVLSPNKCSAQEWADILALCHEQGLRGSANIVFGSIETEAEIIEHLDLVRQLQDRTGGFDSFVAWTFQAQTKDFTVKPIPPHHYLKVLALARLYLDNIQHLEVSVMVQGPETAKIALQMGADDISSPVLEEQVLRSHGVSSEQEARKLIEGAGLKPRRRDFNYRYLE